MIFFFENFCRIFATAMRDKTLHTLFDILRIIGDMQTT